MQLRKSNVLSLNILIAAGLCMLAAGALETVASPAQHTQQAGSAPAASAVQIVHTLSLAGAEQVISAAHAEATKRGAGGAIAVVDAGGHLIALHRLDGTFPAASTVAIEKARTAATFRKPTAAFEDAIKEGRQALLGVQAMTPLRGGVPIMHEGQVVGAVGISGAHSAQEDEELATIGASAIQATN
jgi:glc operon protein GlcG